MNAARIKIDLGFGDQAILSGRAVSTAPDAQRQRDADEFLRRWPRIRSLRQAGDYLRQLGLHIRHCPPGVNSSDSIALLRSAVKSGRISVLIERARKPVGGTCAPTRRSQVIEPSRQSFAEMAAGSGGAGAALAESTSTSSSYSWLPRYDDVSADDLIAYIESVLGKTSAATEDADTDIVPNLASSLEDAAPFTLSDAPVSTADMTPVAMRGVSEEDEAECFAQYERDMDECHAYQAAMGGVRFMQSCSQRAFMNYQQCRGY